MHPFNNSVDSRRNDFQPTNHFLDTATIGIPPVEAVRAMGTTLRQWQDGTLDVKAIDQTIRSSCENFAKIIATDPTNVGILSQVSTASAIMAASLPQGAKVLVAKEDFTSVIFPFLVLENLGKLEVVAVDLDRVVETISPSFDLVAVSSVQSSDGRLIDLQGLSQQCKEHGVKSFVDVTQSAGWLATSADDFDVVACHGYKWLCSPRGTGFIVIRPSARKWLVPILGGWYSGEDPWDSIYGPPLRLASDARAFQVSPDWLSWSATQVSTKLLSELGPQEIGRHNVDLANYFRSELGISPSNSAIVSVDCTSTPETLRDSGIVASFRDGKLRTCFHLYNTHEDANALLKVLA